MAETWNEIYTRRVTQRLPSIGKLETPRILNPVCPDHCSMNHGVDGFLMCPEHRVPIYKVVTHEYPWQDGHFWTTVEPMNGAREGITECPDCKRKLVRRWL